MEQEQARAARISALIYTPISLAVALAFFVIANAMGKYTATAVYGGAAWVFLLSMIVTMPTITPWVKSRLKGQA
ncbi:MAG: hypothetical protein HYY30_05290 [Chloroflexi bacterium]|nr:hypothetical protein [Chloroflexota bacterium]